MLDQDRTIFVYCTVLIRLRDQRMNELHNNMKGGSNVVDLKLGHVETISAANLLVWMHLYQLV